MSDATPIPDSPTSDRDLSFKQVITPLPTLEPRLTSDQNEQFNGGIDIDE